MKKTQDVYGDPIVMERPGAIIRVYRPILDDAERERRMKRLHDSAAALLRDHKKARGSR